MRLLHRCCARAAVFAFLAVVFAGCGFLIDQDRIRIAKIGNEYITRGDLNDVIRRMPDDERPIIQNKGDLQALLTNYIEERIKQEEAAKLEAEKKISVPRELAAAQFDAEHPEYQRMAEMTNLEDFDLTEYDRQVMKEEREINIDKIHRRMLGDAAVQYRARQALENRELTITPEELESEYRMRKDEFHTFEQLTFAAVRFGGDPDQARAQAAQVIERVNAGEAFEAIMAQYGGVNPDSIIPAATIENNPNLAKFRGFWQQMHGASVGQVIGPVYMPPSEKVTESGQTEVMPGSVLVLKVLEHKPEQSMTLEQAADMVAAPIIYAKMVRKLREEYGVEIYEDKLPDPSFLNDPDLAYKRTIKRVREQQSVGLQP